ncbi:MAG: PIG-L deacetylase family protein, partial [Chloroflexota bacterium]
MRTLCAVFAHPDDESFSSGGTLSRYAAEGVEITLVTATSGEAGMITGEKLEIADLRSWRERELRKAAGILGVKHVRLLGLPDGKLAESSQALTQSIRGILFEIRPQVVLTEDVQGITGHPDHVAVTHAVVRAVEDLGESGPLKIY